MLKRKQKEFFWMGALNAIGTGASVLGIAQGSSQADAAAEQNQQQLQAQAAQTAAIQKSNQAVVASNNAIANSITNAVKTNPTVAATAIPHVTHMQPANVTTHMASQTSIMENIFGARTKLFAATKPGFLSNLWTTAKNLHRENPKLAEQVKFGLGMGATLAAGKYVAGRIISNDAEKSGIDLNSAAQQNNSMKQMYNAAQQAPQKNYSILDRRVFADVAQAAVGAGGEQAAKKGLLGKITSGQGLNAVFAVSAGMEEWGAYKAEKKALQGMAAQSGGSVLQRQPQQRMNSELDQRQYSILFGLKRTGKGIFNAASSMMGAGNAKVMQTAGENLAKNAGNNNVQSAVGNFMKNHKYASTAIGLGAGLAAFDVANSLGEKAVEKPLRSMDKKAFAWQDYQNSKVDQ